MYNQHRPCSCVRADWFLRLKNLELLYGSSCAAVWASQRGFRHRRLAILARNKPHFGRLDLRAFG